MAAPTPAQQAATALRLSQPLPKNKFGLRRPFAQDQARDFAQVTGDDLLLARVEQAIGSNGEFPWRPSLTSKLDRIRNIKQGPALDEFARTYVDMALRTFVPEVVAVADQYGQPMIV